MEKFSNVVKYILHTLYALGKHARLKEDLFVL